MPSPESPLLSVKNLKISLADQTIVSDVTFQLKHQERIAIVGPSGSGKSLTLSAIARLLPKKQEWNISGEIFWEGINLLNLDEKGMLAQRKRGIAFIPQEAMCCLNPSMKIGRQLQEIAPFADPVHCLQQVGIANPEKIQFAYPHQLSGGMCQRVVLAICLATKPKLLLADEFTSALDTVSQVQIVQLLDTLCKEHKIGLIVVTHDKKIAAKLCEKTLYMEKGSLNGTFA